MNTMLHMVTGYLAITGLQLALLIIFKYASLKWKRIVRTGEAQLRDQSAASA